MARKKMARGLPVLPKRPVFDAKVHKTEALLKMLRRIALGNQQKEGQPFYTLREVAGWFRAPLSMVAHVYGELESEGLLSGIRGSRTVLQGRSSAHRLKVRGFIAMPASLSCFMMLQKYRLFLMEVRREFWKRGYITTDIFFERSENDPGMLTERIKHRAVDTVLWYLPDKLAKETAFRLADLGIRVLGLSDGGIPAIRCQYQIRREAAINAILDDWQINQKVTFIKIVRDGRLSYADEPRLESLLRERAISFAFGDFRSQWLETKLRSTKCAENTAIMLLSSAASLFSFRAPETLLQLLERCRVALVDGPVGIPFAQTSDACVDLVTVDWKFVAEQIVNDLIAKNLAPVDSRIFEAQAYLRVPLGQYAQRI